MKNFKYLLLLIPLLLVTEVKAASYTGFDYSAQLYDNLGPSLTSVTTSGPSASTGYYEGYVAYTANSSGAAWGISSPITLIANHTYTLTASVPNECGYPILSTYNRIGIGTSLSNAKTSYQNNTNANEVYSKAIGNNTYLIQFAFTPTINGSFIVFPFATSVSCSSSRTFLESISIEDLGVEGVTQDEINNSLNLQTSTITNNITNMGEDIKDSINDANTTCGYQFSETITYSDKSPTSANNEYLNSNGTVLTHASLDSIGVTDYKRIFPGSYLISANNNGLMFDWTAIAFYDKDKNIISTQSLGTNLPSTITLADNVYYFRATVRSNGYTLNLTSQDSICVPNSFIEQQQNQETNDKLDETNNQLGNLNDNLTDSSPTDMSGLGDSAGWLPAGPVDSILTLPLTMLNNLVTNLSNSCQSVSIQLPFVKKNITLPCIKNLYDKMGVTGSLFTTAGLIASAFILFNYLLALYKWVDDTLTMRENTMPGYFDDNWGGGA